MPMVIIPQQQSIKVIGAASCHWEQMNEWPKEDYSYHRYKADNITYYTS